MPGEITPDELDLLDTAFADVRAFGMELAEAGGWVEHLLVGILNATLLEYQHLKLGLRHSGPMVAWACRNLLELHIWTRYVVASEESAQRFRLEALNDGMETYDAFQTWLARNDPELVPPGLDEALRELADRRSESGLAEGEHLRMKRVAAGAGLADEYANMLRLTGKLAHPNAFSVAEEGKIPEMTPVLFRAGAGHGLEIFRLVQESRYNPRSVDWNNPRSSQ